MQAEISRRESMLLFGLIMVAMLGCGAKIPADDEFIKLVALSAVGAYLVPISLRWLFKRCVGPGAG